MIASSFASVQYPILPVIQKSKDGYTLFRRNEKLATPQDFDYSPYFEIIKYPVLGINDLAVYRRLPWDQNGIICTDESECFIPSMDTASISFHEPQDLVDNGDKQAVEKTDKNEIKPRRLGRKSWVTGFG